MRASVQTGNQAVETHSRRASGKSTTPPVPQLRRNLAIGRISCCNLRTIGSGRSTERFVIAENEQTSGSRLWRGTQLAWPRLFFV
jgi:hypothetical protein